METTITCHHVCSHATAYFSYFVVEITYKSYKLEIIKVRLNFVFSRALLLLLPIATIADRRRGGKIEREWKKTGDPES